MRHENSEKRQQFAGALMGLATASGVEIRVERELMGVVQLLEESGSIPCFLADPKVSDEGKNVALTELMGEEIHPVLLHFILILQGEDAISGLRAISDAYSDLIARGSESESGEVLSAVPLAAGKVAEIEREISVILGKDVRLRPRVDTQLLGGVMVRVGDFILDGTLERQLEDLRTSLVS